MQLVTSICTVTVYTVDNKPGKFSHDYFVKSISFKSGAKQ